VSAALRLAREVKSLFETAERQGRSLTAEEHVYGEQLLQRPTNTPKPKKALSEPGYKLGGGVEFNATQGAGGGDSPGARFVSSGAYKSIRTAEGRAQNWSSGAVDVGQLQMKGTLLEGAGGTLVPAQYIPGVVSQAFTAIGLADYFKPK
jgi:hypothetical protein